MDTLLLFGKVLHSENQGNYYYDVADFPREVALLDLRFGVLWARRLFRFC